MQLLYPGFLWGLLGVGIPVLIHLLQLRRPQRVLFSNTYFIREVELTTMRQRKLQELLVLLARVLAVVSLVFLFCQPFISSTKNSKPADDTVEVLLDNSGSMQSLGESGVPLRQTAVAAGEALGKSYGNTVRFRLLGYGRSPVSAANYLQAVATTQPGTAPQGWGRADVERALQKAQSGPLYVFSDFQKTEVPAQVLQQVRKSGEVVLVPFVAKPTANIFVDSVWLNDAFVRAHTNVALHIRLRNGGTTPLADCPMKVLLGQQQVATFQVSVAGGQTSEATVQVPVPDTKLALGRVVTQDSPVTFDNTYYFTLQPAVAIRVLEIGAEPLTRAAFANEPLFTYFFAKPQAADYGILRQANLVVLSEVPQVEAGLREALANVLRRGGSVVVVPPGNATAHATYNELFRALGVVGAQWENSAAGRPERREVLMPNASDPFFKDVFGAQPPRVAMPQVTPVLRMGRAGTDILRLRDGDGFLTELANGAGRAYVFAAPFSKEYSDFAAHALFVPVLYRLAMLSYRTDQLPAYRLTTPALTLTVPAGASRNEAVSYRLVHDSATYIPTQRVQAGQLHLDVPAGLRVPGFYELRRPGGVVTTLAFNAAKGESELAAYSAAELRQLIGPNHPNVRVLENGERPATIASFRAEQAGQPLWRYCLVLALTCLLAEGLLLRLGRPKVVAQTPVLVS